MKILVISDTHIPNRAKELPKKVLDEIKSVDMVVHAGDFTSFNFYLELRALSPSLKAVRGNMDDEDIYDTLPEKLTFEVEGLKFGLTHGFGAPFGIEKRVGAMFDGSDIDLLIFGHTHRATDKVFQGIRMFNPGSPTDRLFAPRRSYGLIEVDKGKIETKIVYI